MTSSVPVPPRLGVDELYTVMLYAAGDSIDAKYAVSQVCRLWRAVALDTAVLWSTFSISTSADAFRMLTVLNRTRRTRLSISLDFTRRTRSVTDEDVPVFDADDRAGIYCDVSPYMPRVRALTVDFGRHRDYIGPSEPLDLLFEFPIPCMEHLSIQWRVSRWVMDSDIFRYRPVPPVRVTLDAALRLRSLRLTNVTPYAWKNVAVATLEVLEVDTRIEDPVMLSDVLDNCPNLTSLALCPSDGRAFELAPTNSLASQTHSIQRVRLGMPFAPIWSVLAPVVDLASLRDIVVSIPGNEPSLSVRDIYVSLLQGFGDVVSCTLSTTFGQIQLPTTAAFEIQNEFRQTRRMEIARVNPFREHVRGFWLALSRAEHGLSTVRSISISRHMWLITSAMFRDYCPNNAIADLTVVLSESFVADESFLAFVQNGLAPKPFPCPALAKLTLEVDEGPKKKIHVALALLGLVDLGNPSRPVEVCFATRLRERWVTRFQVELRERPSWVTCAHCAPPDQVSSFG